MPYVQTDISDVDAVNYAGAAAASAAARLYAMLAGGERDFDHRWFSAQADLPLEDAEKAIGLLAAHVCGTALDNAETLYRQAEYDGICAHEAADWFSESLARRLAWALFTSVCRTVFREIEAAQRMVNAERARQAADNPPLALEDSIFEPHGSLGEMLPHAVEALAAGAARQKAEAAQPEGGADAMSAAGPIGLDAAGEAPGGKAPPKKPARKK